MPPLQTIMRTPIPMSISFLPLFHSTVERTSAHVFTIPRQPNAKAKYDIIAKHHSFATCLAIIKGGWGRKCSCHCKRIFIYYPKKKYLPQGASQVLVPRVLGFIFSYVLIFQVYRWVRCYGLGLFS